MDMVSRWASNTGTNGPRILGERTEKIKRSKEERKEI